jgi:3-oxoacyl-[acyl-carrier protein] reductase
MIREAAPHFCRQGSGVIVNTSSGSGFGHPSYVAYASAKEGVIGLTRTVARELGRFGVRCNAIRPYALGQSTSDYAVNTARWAPLMAATMAPSSAPIDTLVPARIAPMVVWLCTDAASNVNGRTFDIAGNTISRYSEPQRERMLVSAAGWTLDALDTIGPTHLVEDLTNEYALDDHPELQIFEE